MVEHVPEFLRCSTVELVKLQHAASWHFENAEIYLDGRTRRFADVYEEAITSVSAWREGWDSAARLFESLIRDSLVFAEGHFQLGRIYFLQGRHDEALKLARNAAALSPSNGAYEILLIAALFVNGLESEAIEWAGGFARRRGWGEGKVKDSGAARRILSQFMSLALPGYVLSGNKLLPVEVACSQVLEAVTSAAPDAMDHALIELATFIEGNPQFGEIRFWLSELLRRKGNTGRALELCSEASRLRVLDWPILVEFGVLRWNEGNTIGALECFEEAALINENLPMFAPERLSANSARELFKWYQDVLDRLTVKTSAYSGPWPFSPMPALRQDAPQGAKPWPTLVREGFADIFSGTTKVRAWWLLARNDVAGRYRRTTLGPWWVVLGSGIALVGMAVVWSLIFNLEMKDFFPYLSSGYVIWLLLNSFVVEGCTAFSDGQASAIQKSLDMPRFVHVYRQVTRNFILFFHAVVIFLLGAVYYGVDVTWHSLLVIPGLILLFLNGLWMTALFGMVGARFRDFSPAVTAIMTVLFFVTPVMWKVEMLRDRGHIADVNPFTHLIAILREPLLGAPVSVLSWSVAVGLCVSGWILTLMVYSRFRERIIFWI